MIWAPISTRFSTVPVITSQTLAPKLSEDADAVGGTVGSMTDAVGRAFRNRSYVLLTAGFFVCGFHVSFIGTHLPAFLEDGGLASWVAPVVSVYGVVFE